MFNICFLLLTISRSRLYVATCVPCSSMLFFPSSPSSCASLAPSSHYTLTLIRERPMVRPLLWSVRFSHANKQPSLNPCPRFLPLSSSPWLALGAVLVVVVVVVAAAVAVVVVLLLVLLVVPLLFLSLLPFFLAMAVVVVVRAQRGNEEALGSGVLQVDVVVVVEEEEEEEEEAKAEAEAEEEEEEEEEEAEAEEEEEELFNDG
ncbi:hypothetical protein E2C01_077447 [Portunus trituberculatus]|uniref:Uncharacterized protein n=1 Tax=Portunus trituberculatus TaxID=210409 RepID=A0A5B7IKA2_PORTR|nr:hypothetical protein [Portunus trituberculatus]